MTMYSEALNPIVCNVSSLLTILTNCQLYNKLLSRSDKLLSLDRCCLMSGYQLCQWAELSCVSELS